MQYMKTRRMSQNAKLSLWSHLKLKVSYIQNSLKFGLYDIHIQSLSYMMSKSSTVLNYFCYYFNPFLK